MLYFTVLRSRSVLDQLAEGLSVLGVLEAMKLYPQLMEPLFIQGKQKPLTAGKEYLRVTFLWVRMFDISVDWQILYSLLLLYTIEH